MAQFGLTAIISAIILAVLAAVTWSEPAPAPARRTYFPAGSLRADEAADATYEEWYASMLRSMRMPDNPGQPAQLSLYEPPRVAQKHSQEYRAIISKDREYIIAIRAFMDSNGAEVVANEIDNRATGRHRAVHRKLSNDEWSSILHQMPKTAIFQGGHAPAKYKGDCADWVIEEREGPQYNVISESCPTDPEFNALGQAFLNLVGWHAS
jgi:hypothetical protein